MLPILSRFIPIAGLDNKVLVEYEDDGIQEWISSMRIRGGQIQAGALIDARYNDGRWYKAKVIKLGSSKPGQLSQNFTSNRRTSTDVDDRTVHTLLSSLNETPTRTRITQKPTPFTLEDEPMKRVDFSASRTIKEKNIALETDSKTELCPVEHVLNASGFPPTSANYQKNVPTVLPSSQLSDEASRSRALIDMSLLDDTIVDERTGPTPLSLLNETQTSSLLKPASIATPQVNVNRAREASPSSQYAETFDHSKTIASNSDIVVELPEPIEISIPGVTDWYKSDPFAPLVNCTTDGDDSTDKSSATVVTTMLQKEKHPSLSRIAVGQELMGHSSYNVLYDNISTQAQISSRTESCTGTLQQNLNKTCNFPESVTAEFLQLKSVNYETPAMTDFANDGPNEQPLNYMQYPDVNNSEKNEEVYVPQSPTEEFDVVTEENQMRKSNEIFYNPNSQQSCITQVTSTTQALFDEDHQLNTKDVSIQNNNYLLHNTYVHDPYNSAYNAVLGSKKDINGHSGTEITPNLAAQAFPTLQPYNEVQISGTSSSFRDTTVLLRQTERVLTEEYPMENMENELSEAFSNHENLNDEPPAYFPEDISDSEVDTDDDDKPATDIQVIETNNKLGRKYDKVDNCYFCNKAKTNIDRHLITVHLNEYQVLQALAGCKEERERKLSLLRNLGNHKANLDARKKNSGPFFVVYRPNKSTDYRQYVPCCNCYGYYMNRQLYRHKCRAGDRIVSVREGKLLLISCETQISPKLAVILSQLRVGPISFLIRNDPLILRFGESLTKKHGHDHHQNGYIRNRMRQLARLLENLKKIGKAAQLKDFIHPSKFQTVLQAVRITAELDPEKESYGIPSLALKLGHSLKKCGVLVKGEGLETGNMSKVKDCESFLELCSNFWSEEVSSQALRELSDLNMNKNDLPVPSDVIKIHEYLKENLKICIAKISSGTTLEKLAAIRSTAELLLCQLTIFNYRRQGETSKLTVDHFKSAKKISNTVALDSLSLAERQMSERMRRVEVKGKKGKIVPVMFTDDMTSALEKMIEARTQLCPELNNDLLFPSSKPTSKNPNSHLRASDTIRKYAVACGAENPQNLTSTSMRKHVATAMQVSNCFNMKSTTQQNTALDILNPI